MSEKDVTMTIGADGSAANSEFEKIAKSAMTAGQSIQSSFREASYTIASTMKDSMAKVKTEFEKVEAAAKKLNGVMFAITATLAGGEAFKKAVEETVKMTKEAGALSKALGITVTEASILNVALDDCHISSESMFAANKALTKQLVSNEDAFKSLGVATRDQNGHYRNSLDIMLDVNKRLLEFKDGTDRNVEGTKIYGKAWGEVSGTLKLSTEKMQSAEEKAHSLGLIVGKENVEATARYRDAMNDVGDVMHAAVKSVGDALLPILSDLGEWFSVIGPGAVLVIKGAIGGLASTFHILKFVVQEAWEFIAYSIELVTISVVTFADVAMHALKGDWSGAKAAWANGAAALEMEAKKRTDNVIKHAQDAGKALLELFDNPTATTKKGSGENSDGPDKNDKSQSRISEWKSELDAKKDIKENFFKNSLAGDEAFWKEKAKLAEGNAKEEAAIVHELFTIHKTMAIEKFTAEQDNLKAEISAARAGSEERINLATKAAQRVGEAYGWESKEYMAAIKEIKKVADEFDKEQERLSVMKMERTKDHALSQITMETQQLSLMKSLGQISDQQEIVALQKLEERKYQLEAQALNDKITLGKLEGADRQAQLDEIAKLEEKHSLEMSKLNGKRMLAIKNDWEKMLGGVSGAFEQSLTGMITGTQTLQKSMANIGQAILSEFIKIGLKRVTAWVSDEAAMLMASKMKNTVTAVGDVASATKAVTEKGTEAVAVVSANAAEGAAGAAASQAAIPIIGPGLAAGAFAAVMAMIMGAGSLIKSSAGGEWQVPTDRLNIVHKDETILPAHIAGPLRDMVSGGGNGGGTHLHVHAIDASGVKEFFSKHGSTIMDTIQRQGRSFNYGKAGRP